MQKKFSENELHLAISERQDRAEKMLKDMDKTERFLIKLEKKLATIPYVGTLLADVPTLISLVRSYIKKEYTLISPASVVAVTAALLYVFSPIDIIPDVIPGIGFLDDAAVVAYLMKKLHEDLGAYREWRQAYGVMVVASDAPGRRIEG